jgi:hypothetical protein
MQTTDSKSFPKPARAFGKPATDGQLRGLECVESKGGGQAGKTGNRHGKEHCNYTPSYSRTRQPIAGKTAPSR